MRIWGKGQVRSGFPGGARRPKRYRFDPWSGRFPQRREWQPTAVFLPGESSGTEEPGGLQPMDSQGAGHD